MEGITVLKSREGGLKWSELNEALDTMTKEEQDVPCIVYKRGADSETYEDTLRAGYVSEVWRVDEDMVNPAGDGVEPASSYLPEELEGEPILIKKGQIILIVES